MEQLAATALRHRRLQQELTEKMRARAALEQRIRELCAQTEAHEQRRRGDLEQRRAALAREQAELAAVRDALARGARRRGPGGAGPRKRGFVPVQAQAAGRGQPDTAPPMPKGAPVWIWALAALLGLGGLALLLSRLALPGAAALGAGLCLAAFGGVLSASARKKGRLGGGPGPERRKRRRMRRRAQGSGASWTSFFGHFGVSDESQWKPCLRKLEQALAAYTDTDARLRGRPCGRGRWRRPAPPAPPRRRPQPWPGRGGRRRALDTEIAAMQGELQVRLEHQQAADGLQSRINELDEREAELRRRLEVYKLALAALENAHDEMTRLFAPALNERAAELFASLAGPARTVKIDAAGDVRIEEGGAVHEIGYYSTGTADAAYIAMRLACVELLYTEEKPPLVFDDSLCNLDPCAQGGGVRAAGACGAVSDSVFYLP